MGKAGRRQKVEGKSHERRWWQAVGGTTGSRAEGSQNGGRQGGRQQGAQV